MDKQIETKMIENTTGSLAVCLDKDSKFNGWMFSKHPDGKWVTKRLALPMEIKQAQDKLEQLEIAEGIPCRGVTSNAKLTGSAASCAVRVE